MNSDTSARAIAETIGTAENVFFANEPGGVVNGNVLMGNGNDTVELFSGSAINGISPILINGVETPQPALAGGTGYNTLILTGTTENGKGTLGGSLLGFNVLSKQGSGVWEITGALDTTKNSLAAEVFQGTLILSGTTSDFIGTMTVDGPSQDGGPTLQIGNPNTNGGTTGDFKFAASSPSQVIEDNGTVAFARSDTALNFTTAVDGTGRVAQIGGGTTTLSGPNTYSGGTFFFNGTLAVGSDPTGGSSAPLGAPGTIGLVFDGGTFQNTNSFELNPARPVTIEAGGGTINTSATAGSEDGNPTDLTITQNITGAGVLTKVGGGNLTLSGSSTYQGGTNLDAGTITVGNNAALGIGTLAMAAGTTLSWVASSNFTVSNNISISGDPNFTPPSGTVQTLSGMIADGSSPGTLNMEGPGTLVLTGTNTYSGGTTISAGTLQLGAGVGGGPTGSIEGNVADDGTLAFNRDNTLNFTGLISGTGDVNQIGSGTTVLFARNDYSGQTTVAAGTLAAGAVNTFSAASHTVVMSGATLNLNGFNQTLDEGLVNAGTVRTGGDPGPTTAGTTLTVAGDYVGEGGTIVLSTFLGTDNSPSDKLVVNGGTATGPRTLTIENTTGPGAQTTENGILVVEALNDAVTTDPFTLAKPVVGGPFEYLLFSGGPVPGTNPNDWFLRNTMDTPQAEDEEESGAGGDELVKPGESFPTTPADELEREDPDKEFPIIGPNLATYGVVQPIARELGMTMLGTLHERIGDTLTVENAGTGPVTPGQSAWGRFFGAQIDNSYRAFAAPNANGQIFGFQAGLDLWRGSFVPEQRDAAGLYFAYGVANLNINGLVTNAAATAYVRSPVGTLGLNGYSVGAYWTHYGPGNWYLDAVVQGTIYGGSADAQFSNFNFTTNLPTDGLGVITSLEAGYPVALPLGPRFVLEPQAQILWQNVGFNRVFDGLQTVGLGTTSGVTGRLGIRGQWTIEETNGQVWQPYWRANFWRAWGGTAATSFGASTNPVPLVTQATWGEVAAGVTFKHTDRLSYYAQFGYQFALTNNTSISGFIGDIGLRYTW